MLSICITLVLILKSSCSVMRLILTGVVCLLKSRGRTFIVVFRSNICHITRCRFSVVHMGVLTLGEAQNIKKATPS